MKHQNNTLWIVCAILLTLASVWSPVSQASTGPAFSSLDDLVTYSNEMPPEQWPQFEIFRKAGKPHAFNDFRARSLYLPGVLELTVEQAKWIARRKWDALIMPDLGGSSVEAIQALKATRITSLDLGHILLTEKLSAEIAHLEVEELKFTTLRELSLRKFMPLILLKHSNRSINVELGLRQVDMKLAELLAKANWGGISLPNLQTLSPEVAKQLQSFRGFDLGLPLRSLNTAALTELLEWKLQPGDRLYRNLMLHGKGPLNPEHVRVLSQRKSGLVIFRDIENISQKAISAMNSGTLKDVRFPSIERLDVDTVTALVRVDHRMTFDFRGVRSLDTKLIHALTKKSKCTFRFPVIETLDKTAAATLMKRRIDAIGGLHQGMARLEIDVRCQTPGIRTLLTDTTRRINFCRSFVPREERQLAQYESESSVKERARRNPQALGQSVLSFINQGQKTSRVILRQAILELPLNSGVLGGLGVPGLRKLRNTAYALEGARFKSRDLQSFFQKQDWYLPNKAASQVKLSSVGQKNVTLSRLIETRLKKSHVGDGLSLLFNGYFNGVAVFSERPDGEHATPIYFVSIDSNKTLLKLSGRGASMGPGGQVSFSQKQVVWKPNTENTGLKGWKALDCVDHKIPAEYRLNCWPIYDAFLDLKERGNFWEVLRTGFGKGKLPVVTHTSRCVCDS